MYDRENREPKISGGSSTPPVRNIGNNFYSEQSGKSYIQVGGGDAASVPASNESDLDFLEEASDDSITKSPN